MNVRSQHRRAPEETARAFAATFRRLYPRFRWDRALFLDMEGVLGWEVAMALYAPGLAKKRSFVSIVADQGGKLPVKDLDRAMREMGLEREDVEWLVTFGAQDHDEVKRLNAWFGGPAFGAAMSVNLKRVMDATPGLGKAARVRGLVHRARGPRNRRPRFEKSLTVLEREFGIVRPPEVWVHKKSYGRRMRQGTLSPMELGRRVQKGEHNEADLKRLATYLWWEVGTMAEMTRMIEKEEV